MPVAPVDSQEMIAVAEMSTVGTFEDNCEADMNAYQSPCKPYCNGIKYNSQVNDVKSSNVIGTGADPLNVAAANDEDIISRELSGSPEVNIELDQLGELGDQSEILDSGKVEAGKQHFSGSPKSHAEFENQVTKLDDRNENLEAANGEVNDLDLSCSQKIDTEVEVQVTKSDNENEQLHAANGAFNEQGSSGSPKSNTEGEDQVMELNDGDEKLDATTGEVNEQYLSVPPKSNTEINDQVAESNDEDKKLDAVSEQDSSGSPESNIEGEDQVAGFYDQNDDLDAVNGKASRHANVGISVSMKDTENYPPLVKSSNIKSGHGVHVSSVDLDRKTRSWMEIVTLPPARVDVKVESQVHTPSAVSSRKMNGDVTVSGKEEVLNSFDVKNDSASNVEDVKDVADLSEDSGSAKEKLYLEESGGTRNCNSHDIIIGSFEGSIADEVNVMAVSKPFNFLIKVPRTDDRNLQEQINLAQQQVDDKTKLRDGIQIEILEKKANSQIHGAEYENAKDDVRKAKRLVSSKRMEIDSLLTVIIKAKNALSIEDINKRIDRMEHAIQHETVSLKEEKQLIREIKQLKQLQEQLPANLGSQDEIKQAIEQRDETEVSLKILRKELDILKDSVVKAEAAALEAEKKYDAEYKEIKELQMKSRAANDVRQAAYVQLQNLRKKLSAKNNHFFSYKDDAAAASRYAFSGNKKALHDLCTNQVEKFMELWNTNDKFRKDYVKFNERSTVRRLGTLDGHSLGPLEKPLVLPSYDHERVDRMISTPAKANLVSQIPTLELKKKATVRSVALDDKFPKKKTTEHKNRVSKQLTEHAVNEQMLIQEGKKLREEAVLKEKAKEILRREETEAKMKEQHRLVEMAKAEVAREKKKRQAEKVQMRAELKALKETEEREKERLRRLEKKERKKAKMNSIANAADDTTDCEAVAKSEATPETRKEAGNKEDSTVVPKKPKAAAKPKPAPPPPVRNRNRKMYRQWMWTFLVVIGVYTLFWLGNSEVFMKLNAEWQSLQ